MAKKTILVVDDNSTNLNILLRLLEDYDVIAMNNGFDALAILKQEVVDLILLDVAMPEIDGYEVCQILKARNEAKDVPVIFLCAQNDTIAAEKAYDVGAIDLIRRPVNPKELLAKVNIQLQLQTLIQELQNSQEELKLLIATDPLTNLYNKKYFIDTAKYTFQLARREKTDLSLIILDIDNFKKINDHCGHKAGDKVIKELALKLQTLMRKSDILCRFGGEEFIVLLPGTGMKGAVTTAEKIRQATAKLLISCEHKIPSGTDQEISLTISAGVAQINLQQDNKIDSIILRADLALYEAKNSGKNTVCSKD